MINQTKTILLAPMSRKS